MKTLDKHIAEVALVMLEQDQCLDLDKDTKKLIDKIYLSLLQTNTLIKRYNKV